MANNERRTEVVKALGDNINIPGLVKQLYYGEDGPGGEKGVVEQALADAVASTNTQLDDVALAALAPVLTENLFAQLDKAWNGVLSKAAAAEG